MTRPTKFEIMRRQRRHQQRHVDTQRLREEARALGYDDTDLVIDALQELDARRWLEDRPKRSWWQWIFQRGTAA
jgi:hypothetical protein